MTAPDTPGKQNCDLRGDILIAGEIDAIHEVERSYHDAIAVSQNQGARSLELRATCSLARLLRSRGRHDEACARLAPILGWFTEGQDTADLIVAKSLLNNRNLPL